MCKATFLEENTEDHFCDLRKERDFFKETQKTKTIKENISTFHHIKK
jgi:hypothetical protein